MQSPGRTLRVVVMGVSGSGKSTVGVRLARRIDAEYLDADTAHSQANIDKMAAGIPLTDTDRGPWLERLVEELRESDRIVVTCSSLKRSYRDVLRRADGVEFAYLEIAPTTARERLEERTGHFMQADMVDSQFAALEQPTPDESDVITIDGEAPIDAVVDAVVADVVDRLVRPTS